MAIIESLMNQMQKSILQSRKYQILTNLIQENYNNLDICISESSIIIKECPINEGKLYVKKPIEEDKVTIVIEKEGNEQNDRISNKPKSKTTRPIPNAI